ncbi:replication initiation protein [Fusobacterium sp.]|uniref:replication initiation protein n=1 Tax=Fusobacterium sp. TaxID=68766 RepID=UPI0028FEA6C2|nr:replication initiation protein [Fusobacterium sp.]MDU1912644.1 replication initiation protein [Fusobacterium sp.]
MANVVKYGNEMNNVTFGGFKEKELDLFFSICFKAKEQGVREIKIPFDEIKLLSNYVNRNLDRFIKDLETTYDKMLKLNIKIRHSELSFSKFNLFNKYSVNVENRIISIKVSDEFEHLLNNLIGNYTKFDLIEFVNLKSVYSKNMFKLLKQWDVLGEKNYELENLKMLLGVPKNYSSTNFNERVIKPILKELPQYFKSLKLEKIRTGRKISHLKFTWKINKERMEYLKNIEKEVVEIVISEELSEVIEKVKKNRYIAPFLNNGNIEELLNNFDEKSLIIGLNCCNRTIKKEITSINYLIKAIESECLKKSTEKKVPMTKKFFAMGYEIVPNEEKYGEMEQLDENTEKELERINKMTREELIEEFTRGKSPEIENKKNEVGEKLLLAYKMRDKIKDKKSTTYLTNELFILELHEELEELETKAEEFKKKQIK